MGDAPILPGIIDTMLNDNGLLLKEKCKQGLMAYLIAVLRFRFGLGLGIQTLWLHSTVPKLFTLVKIQTRIPFL